MARMTGLAAAIGAVVAAKYGDSLGTAVQAVLVAVAGLVAAVATHEHQSNQRATLSASVQVGAHQSIADTVAAAVHHALTSTLAAPAAPVDSVQSAPPGATVQPPQT